MLDLFVNFDEFFAGCFADGDFAEDVCFGGLAEDDVASWLAFCGVADPDDAFVGFVEVLDVGPAEPADFTNSHSGCECGEDEGAVSSVVFGCAVGCEVVEPACAVFDAAVDVAGVFV